MAVAVGGGGGGGGQGAVLDHEGISSLAVEVSIALCGHRIAFVHLRRSWPNVVPGRCRRQPTPWASYRRILSQASWTSTCVQENSIWARACGCSRAMWARSAGIAVSFSTVRELWEVGRLVTGRQRW